MPLDGQPSPTPGRASERLLLQAALCVPGSVRDGNRKLLSPSSSRPNESSAVIALSGEHVEGPGPEPMTVAPAPLPRDCNGRGSHPAVTATSRGPPPGRHSADESGTTATIGAMPSPASVEIPLPPARMTQQAAMEAVRPGSAWCCTRLVTTVGGRARLVGATARNVREVATGFGEQVMALEAAAHHVHHGHDADGRQLVARLVQLAQEMPPGSTGSSSSPSIARATAGPSTSTGTRSSTRPTGATPARRSSRPKPSRHPR